jgi:hypothetical protein
MSAEPFLQYELPRLLDLFMKEIKAFLIFSGHFEVEDSIFVALRLLVLCGVIRKKRIFCNLCTNVELKAKVSYEILPACLHSEKYIKKDH